MVAILSYCYIYALKDYNQHILLGETNSFYYLCEQNNQNV